MDNDHKVIIQKPEVELFLQDDVYAFNREKPQVYDIEKEFAKVKANKKHTIFWPLIILFIFSAFLTFGITHYIRYQNRQISVNVDVFEDINLRKLLDMVSRLEEQIKQAKTNKTRAETKMQTELDNALADKNTEIYTIQALPISEKEKNKKIAEAESNYEAQVAEINERYLAEFSNIDLEIANLQEQLNAYDSANVERAQQQQAAIDSQRQLFEIEKQQLKESYEKTITQLQNELAVLKSEEFSIRVKLTEELSKEYKAQYAALEKELNSKINALDPKITQTEYLDILDRVNKLPPMPHPLVPPKNLDVELNGENVLEGEIQLENPKEIIETNDVPAVEVENNFDFRNISNIPDELKKEYEDFMVLSKDYDETTKLLLSLPQKNDIPEFVVAMNTLNTQMNNDLFELLVNMTDDFNSKENNLVSQNMDLQTNLKAEQDKNLELEKNNAIYAQIYSYFENQALTNGDSGYILDVTDKNKVLVYVSPLFAKEINSTLAYVFRKSDDLIGTITLIKENDFYYGIPSSDDVALAIKPGDKILLEVEK